MTKITKNERLHRIHVLMMDIEIANEQGDEDEYNNSLAELYHYATSDKLPTHSYRWETEEEVNHDQALMY